MIGNGTHANGTTTNGTNGHRKALEEEEYVASERRGLAVGREPGAVLDNRRVRNAGGAYLELSALANERTMLQRELDRWHLRRAEIQQRLKEIAKKEARLLAVTRSDEQNHAVPPTAAVKSPTAGAEGPLQEQGHLILNHGSVQPPNERSASFEIVAMRRQTTMAEPGTEQRSTSQDTEGRYVYAVVDDGGDQGVLDIVGVDGGRVYTTRRRPARSRRQRYSESVASVPSGDVSRPTTRCSNG